MRAKSSADAQRGLAVLRKFESPLHWSRLGLIFFWAIWSTACSQGSSVSPASLDRSPRLEAIRRGLAQRANDPNAAAEALAGAGVGSELELLRFEVWFDALERGKSLPTAWRDYLDQAPPQELADRARLALAKLLIGEGQVDKALEILAGVSAKGGVQAETVRLACPDHIRDAAAVRLAVVAPLVLRREAPSLEKAAVAALGPEGVLDRAVAWREAGHPNRGAAEIRAFRSSGPLEERRRLELARCELRRGATSGALAVLPPLSRSDGDEALVRASCWRRRGWSRYPGPTAAEAFRNCLVAAQRARQIESGDSVPALELQLECGTESGDLGSAFEAWQSLARVNWQGSRRSWMGRRLGIALAESGRFRKELESLASSVKEDSRCLQFAAATASTAVNREVLADLATLPIPDLYALWSIDAIGESGPVTLQLPNDGDIGVPPPTVAWLLDQGEDGFASQEWRRLAAAGGILPGEAMAAAAFEEGRGRPDLAIRWLRRGFADLGGTLMNRVPRNSVRAYLPLRWTNELKAAAREFGLDPWLLAGLARQESIFNPRARSPAGARGVVQLMPGTARGHAVALGLGRTPDLFDPGLNLRLGARELSRLMEAFGEVEPALAAYNAGESRVRAWWRRWPEPQLFTEAVPIPETYTYIRRVRFLSEAYRLVWAEEWDE